MRIASAFALALSSLIEGNLHVVRPSASSFQALPRRPTECGQPVTAGMQTTQFFRVSDLLSGANSDETANFVQPQKRASACPDASTGERPRKKDTARALQGQELQ